jgi:putative DNA primase/helicase
MKADQKKGSDEAKDKTGLVVKSSDPDRIKDIDLVRAGLDHPKNHIVINPDGSVSFVKPPKRSITNVHRVLTLDDWYSEKVKLNNHSMVVEWDGAELTDADILGARLQIAADYDLDVSTEAMHEVIRYTARANGYHPIAEWLGGLSWDGEPRMGRLLDFYAGAEETDLNVALSRRFMISCVARVLNPGCKVDTVLILAGDQGMGKSTFFRVLASAPWFRDTAIDLRNKDAFLSLRGAWIYEMAELASMKPRNAETVKAFLSAQEDHFRPPYARTSITQYRQCVFVGSTNEPSFLTDPTGARRFWPVKITRAPSIPRVQEDRDQLWAEAVAAYRAGERHWLELNESDSLKESQEQFKHEDPWTPKIEDWAYGPPKQSGFSVTDVLDDALNKATKDQNKADEMRIGGILTGLGFVKRRTKVTGRRVIRWYPPDR